jgi:hypothetical protein
MRLDKSMDDPGDAGNGGGGVTPGGGGTLYTRKTITITWAFPANSPNPEAFEVVAFTGTDPTDTTAYLFAPVRVLGADREFKRSIFPKTSLTNVNAAVRAVYA